jgi:hypothetical protein
MAIYLTQNIMFLFLGKPAKEFTVWNEISCLRPEMTHFQTTATSIIINVPSIQKLFIYKFCSSNKNFENQTIEMES